MPKKIASIALISLGCLLILAAIGLAVYNIWDDSRAQSTIDGILTQLEPMLPSAPDPTDGQTQPTGGYEDVLPDYVLDANRPMPTVEIDGYLYIGTVTIPSLELELPVMDTWDYVRMRTAPCRYTGTAYLHNLVICAHNYASHFGRLKNLVPGDRVIFTDVDGNVFSYTVEQIETLAGTAVEEMQSGEWDLTLFTCTIGGRTRVTVRCREEKQTDDFS